MTIPATVSPCPLRSDGSLAGQRSRRHMSDIPQQHRHAVIRQDDDALDVVDGADATQPTHRVLLFAMHDEAAAEVGVVVLHARQDVVQRKVIAAQREWIDLDRCTAWFRRPTS